MSGILNDKQKEIIIDRFYKLYNTMEFVELLNYLERVYINTEKEFPPFELRQIYHLSNTKESRYTQFQIFKKNGGLRTLNTPDKFLMRVLTVINFLLQIVFEYHSNYNSHGFLLGKDIKSNATPHINKNYVLNMDIKDFFPSINFRRVKVVLELSPFNLNYNREQIGFLIANLATYSNFLPQGSPTSPILSNIVTQRLDRRMTQFCNHRRIKYTRYADDLTFSSNKNIFEQSLINSFTKIIVNENFNVNVEKTRVRTLMDRQEVTGLIVNEKLNVKREYLQKVRAMLNNWEKGGLSYAENEFRIHQPEKKDYNFKEVLFGHISFIKLIKGNTKMVDRLSLKYSFLKNQIDYSHIRHQNVKNRLKKDNIKMEKLLFDDGITSDDLFISFCTSAFHQIENLINYYYWKKFPVFENLLETLILENPHFKQRYKLLETAKNSFKKIKDLNINVLVYLYEKEFFFDKNIYYSQQITKLREIRNDESHRCEVVDIDREKIIKDYGELQNRIKLRKAKKKNYDFSNEEKKLTQNYEVLEFLNLKNYKDVRKTLKEVNDNVRHYITY